MRKIHDITFQKGTQSDRKAIVELSRLIGVGVPVLYVYSLVDETIQYPLKKGRILYIGEAFRIKSPTGDRFKHIAPNMVDSNNYLNNYTLSAYYHTNAKLRLRVYELPNEQKRKDIELVMLTMHLDRFGAKPMAQGATGEYNTPKFVNSIKRSITTKQRAILEEQLIE